MVLHHNLKADGSVDSSTYLTSVGTNNISDDAVTTAKLAADSVTEAKIADNAVTHDKYQEVATDTIIGRTATGTGIVTALSATEVRGIINVANGAQANVDTNLSVTRNATSVTIVSSTGDNATIGEATGTNAGAMTSSMHDKLDGIATGADVTGSNNAAGLTGSPDISVNTATITGGTLNVGANSSNLLGEVTIFKGDDFSTASQPGINDNIYLSSDATSGNNVYGASIAFSRVQYQDRRAAAIAAVQTSSDEDQVGLAFFTHPSATATEAIVEQLRIKHNGNIGINETDPYYRLHMVFTNTDTSLSGGGSGNWGSDGIIIENTSTTVGSMSLAHFRNTVLTGILEVNISLQIIQILYSWLSLMKNFV